MATSLTQQVETWRSLLYFGHASVSDIVRWADEWFKRLEEYNDDLANVCLAVNVNPTQMDQLLKRLAVGADLYNALRQALGVMYRAVVHDNRLARVLARGLFNFYAEHGGGQLPNDLLFLACVEDGFALAEDGCVGEKDALQAFIKQLAPFDRTA